MEPEVGVFLFTGFLESGKSTCFQEILEEGMKVIDSMLAPKSTG